MVVIETSKGNIQIELDDKNAPQTVANFLQYVRSEFYQDTIFHRVIDGFMIQGGGLTSDMETKVTNASVSNEAKTALPNQRGTIAMARTMDPHSATSQFFINVADNAFLNYSNEQNVGYCVFGNVVEGMDVVDSIAKARTGQVHGHGDVPLEEITIHKIREI